MQAVSSCAHGLMFSVHLWKAHKAVKWFAVNVADLSGIMMLEYLWCVLPIMLIFDFKVLLWLITKPQKTFLCIRVSYLECFHVNNHIMP